MENRIYPERRHTARRHDGPPPDQDQGKNDPRGTGAPHPEKCERVEDAQPHLDNGEAEPPEKRHRGDQNIKMQDKRCPSRVRTSSSFMKFHINDQAIADDSNFPTELIPLSGMMFQ